MSNSNNLATSLTYKNVNKPNQANKCDEVNPLLFDGKLTLKNQNLNKGSLSLEQHIKVTNL